MSDRTEKEKMLAGELYNGMDPDLLAERARAKELCASYNSAAQIAPAKGQEILKQLLGSVAGSAHIEPTFRCDYGTNIHLGDNFYANFDLIILDVCEVRIGKNCFIAPRVCILTATHPTDTKIRISGLEYGEPITIGDNAWIGAGAIINPGVTIGDNVVIGSGAVVTRDVPSDSVYIGVPAKALQRSP